MLMQRLAVFIAFLFAGSAICAHFNTSATMMATGLENQYLINIVIEDSQNNEILANSSFICLENEKAELRIANTELSNSSEIAIQAFVPKTDSAEKKADLHVLIQQNDNTAETLSLTAMLHPEPNVEL